VRILGGAPCSLTSVLERLGLYHRLQLNADQLVRQGLIGQSTLTPTDLLHVTGEFRAWSTEAARAAVGVACTLFEREQEALCREVFHHMAVSIVEEVLVFLGRRKAPDLPERIRDPWGKWFLERGVSGGNPYIEVAVSSRFPIIGIGAPAGVFLKRVAEYLKAPLFLPPFAHVANAVGAVAGSVMVVREALVYPYGDENIQCFYVQAEGERARYSEVEEALLHAREVASEAALGAAVEAGAVDPRVFVEVSREGAFSRVTAKALGNPRLSW